MMGDLVNFNRFKKNAARDERSKEAAANRVKHGRTKAEKTAIDAAQKSAFKKLEDHKIEE
jgi:Domain of unknown function (DUF4169)